MRRIKQCAHALWVGVLCASTSLACADGGASAPPTTARNSARAPDDGGRGSAAGRARGKETGPGKGGGEPKDGKPFAGSTNEATELISEVVDKRHSEIGVCVRSYRARRKLASGRVAVSFGIDQEGRLLGVTSKGKEDAELKTCIQDALKNAPFPRSHAGVITVTKTYEDLVVE